MRGGILRGPAPLSHPNTPPPSAFPRKNSHSTPPPAAFPRKNSPSTPPPAAFPRKNSHSTPPPAAFPRKNSHSTPENANLGHFSCAGRTFSRTGHGHVPTLKPITPLQPLMQASMKPPAPLLAPKQRPLKPATPLQPKNARKTASFRPQRRRRFHARDFQCPRAAAGPGCGTRGRRRGLAGRPVGGRRYKRRQTNTIHIASRGPLLQTSSI